MTAPPPILFGIETEIGITCDTDENLDVVAESIALVRSVVEPGVLMRWDYGSEDPHADMRGFRVQELRQDTDEANYYAEDDRSAKLSYVEIKSDLVLGNGARFYNDHAHPEYCTPECSTLDELVAQDRAGERILMACAQQLTEQRGHAVRLYKNNTDFRGHSYGCHENYLLPRSLPWEQLAQGMQAFLVTRQIYAGAGKFAIEEEDRFVSPGFPDFAAQRFFQRIAKRGHHAAPAHRQHPRRTARQPAALPAVSRHHRRRQHVAVRHAVEGRHDGAGAGGAGARPAARLAATGRAAGGAAGDFARPEIPLGGEARRAQDLRPPWRCSANIWRRSRRCAICRDPAKAALVADWETVLNDLETDVMRCRNRLDWVAKLALVREFQAAQNIAPDDPWLQSLDLEYHRLDLAEGLYYGLEQGGAMLGVPDEAAVRRAVREPPYTTRALCAGQVRAEIRRRGGVRAMGPYHLAERRGVDKDFVDGFVRAGRDFAVWQG